MPPHARAAAAARGHRFAAYPRCSTDGGGTARGGRPGREHGARGQSSGRSGCGAPEVGSYLPATPDPRGVECRVRDRLAPRPTGGQVRLACVPAQVSGRRFRAVLSVGRRSFAGLINVSGAPCHALPGRVGEEGSVNQAYDLACCQAGWRRGSAGSRPRRSNKRMQQTRGGWRRAGASWSAQSPRTRARSCAPRS